jgi:DNA-binding NtrC family response regulator/pSer/pThr/pTyr-binding forkhead associated (FHA) protein
LTILPHDPEEITHSVDLRSTGDPNAADGERSYLMVFDSGSSSTVRVPPLGDLHIGRAERCELRLKDTSVSRKHARLTSAGGETLIVDLGSRNGIRVNGERVAGERTLASGDVIALGNVTLVYQRDSRGSSKPRAVLDLEELRQRTEEEIERALRYDRQVAMVCFVPEQPSRSAASRLARAVGAHLRIIDVIAFDEGRVMVLMPELPVAAVQAVGERLLAVAKRAAPLTRAGFSCCPQDGCDVDTILGRAREAALAAHPSEIHTTSVVGSTVQIGDQTVVIADPAMARLLSLLERLAASDLPVLICGETGVGKELAALALHSWSPRKAAPLVAINCAAIQETLVESELFGHEKGAFSGALSVKAGKLESAHGGTVFLDEVAELPAAVQAKLLRVLETKKVSRLGSLKENTIDVRLVAATNRRLNEEVLVGRFREDLYFRLSAATVILPPLRDRPRDLPILAQTFLAQARLRLGRPPMTITPSAMQRLAGHAWPGNVRELRNLMDYVAATRAESTLEPEMLPDSVFAARKRLGDDTGKAERLATPWQHESTFPHVNAVVGDPAQGSPERRFQNIYDELRDLERARMAEALDAAGGVQARAAELIGMPLRTFVTKLKQYDLGSGNPRRRRP